MLLTNEALNEIMGYNISEDSFFSEGTVIMFDDAVWELTDVVGDQLVFKQSFDVRTAKVNNEFFYERSRDI